MLLRPMYHKDLLFATNISFFKNSFRFQPKLCHGCHD